MNSKLCNYMNFARNNKEEIMIDPKDALTEQELENLVALDASAQTEAAGGITAAAGLAIGAAALAGVSTACTDTCSSWVKNL